MAADSVAEINAPGQRRGDAVGVVGEAREEAADAAEGDAERERRGEEVAGGARFAGSALGPFDREQTSDQRADNRFAAEEVDRIAPTRERLRGIFKPVEDAAA